MSNELLEERLNGIEGLPALPVVLQQIRKIMNNPRSSMAQIAMVVAKDQALASRTIRLVNSAFYARAVPVASIQQAIVALGLNTLNNLMLGLSVIKMFGNSTMHGFDHEAFWKHSFATALLARKLAVRSGYAGDREECFMAGLLHDMGRLVMEQFLHDGFIRALDAASRNGTSLFVGEMEAFGFSHADAGAWLGRRWAIPRQFADAMELHHTPESAVKLDAGEKEMVRLVAAANEVAVAEKIGSSGEARPTTRVIGSLPGLSSESLNDAIRETRDEVAATLNEWKKA